MIQILLIGFLGGCGLVASFAGRKGFLGPDDNCSAFDGSLVKILTVPEKKNVILLEKIRRGLHLLHSYRQRKDLNKAAIKRAAIIVRSQTPLPTRKGGNKTAAKESDIHFLIRFLGCGLVTSFAGWKGFLGPDDNSSAFDGSLVKILAVPEKNQKCIY